MNRSTNIALCVACGALLLAAVPLNSAVDSSPEGNAGSADPHAIVQGMTVSCHRAGQIWGTKATAETFTELKALGCNWVAIHPYADIRADGTVNARYRRMYDDPDWLTRPIEEAHRRGLKILIKPHLAYWGSPFDWRGDIEFDTDAQWQRFFETYEQWITQVAELARNADGFAVGTELDATIHHEDDWRRIIESVGAKTDAPLTYCANWDTYKQVPFWDALDVIGIQAYFPLVQHDRTPTPAELRRGWAGIIDELERFSSRHNRRILLSELGYNRSSQAARRPWDHREGGDNAELIQQWCLEVALDAIADSDAICGAFLWKWFPNRPDWGNFLKSTPAMRAVIAESWADSGENGAGAADVDAARPPQ